MNLTTPLPQWLARRFPALAAVALVPLLASCATTAALPGPRDTGAAPRATPRETIVAVRPPARPGLRIAEPHMLPGLEGVIGAGPAELAHQFGPARLEVWEGDARKLQFSGDACVLDVYLYPGPRGNELQATYVDARRLADGKDVDRATCVAALRMPAKPTPP